jgi:hypothetical protein
MKGERVSKGRKFGNKGMEWGDDKGMSILFYFMGYICLLF